MYPLNYTTDHHISSYKYLNKMTFIPSLDDEGVVFACNMTRPTTDDLYRSCVVGSFDIVSRPTVTINYQNQNGFVVVGSMVVFTSAATTVTSTLNRTFWTVSGELQNATHRYSIDGHQFTLRDIQEEDTGSSIMYVVIDNDGVQGVAIVTIQTIDVVDLLTQPPDHAVSTTGSTKAWTTEPAPPEDYSAVIIGSLFAALLVVIMVVMVCIWYWREVRGKKSPPAVLVSEEAAKKASQQKTSLDQGVKVASDVAHHPRGRQRDLHGGVNPKTPPRDGNQEPLEFKGIHSEEKHHARDEHSPTKQGTSTKFDKYRYSNHYTDDGPVDHGHRSHYYKQCHEAHIDPVENQFQYINDKDIDNRYQTTDDKNMHSGDLYDYSNDAYDGSYDDENTLGPRIPGYDRYGAEPETDDVSRDVFNDGERSYGRLTQVN